MSAGRGSGAAAPGEIAWEKGGGLLPAIVQHADTRAVLMLGYMNREAYAASCASGAVTFWSRSRGRLWRKGDTSGHALDLVSLAWDCDADTLLVQARPRGPVCHRGTPTCFDPAATPTSHDRPEVRMSDDPLAFFAELDALIAARAASRPAGSYTTELLDAGVARVAQKVGEEGVETALAAVTRDDDGLVDEAADLVYHLVVLLRARGMGFEAVAARLRARHG